MVASTQHRQLVSVDKTELLFNEDDNSFGSTFCTERIVLQNIRSDTAIAFKVLTTNQADYVVRPNCGVISTEDSKEIIILQHNVANRKIPCNDKLKLLVSKIHPNDMVSDLEIFWRNARNKKESSKDIQTLKFSVRNVHSKDKTTDGDSSLNSTSASNQESDLKLLKNDNTINVSQIVKPDKDKLSFRLCSNDSIYQREKFSNALYFNESLLIRNISSNNIVFKIKTVNVKDTIVRPNIGILSPSEATSILFHIKSEINSCDFSKFKFLLQVALVNQSQKQLPKGCNNDKVARFWNSLSPEELKFNVYRLKFNCEGDEKSSSIENIKTEHPCSSKAALEVSMNSKERVQDWLGTFPSTALDNLSSYGKGESSNDKTEIYPFNFDHFDITDYKFKTSSIKEKNKDYSNIKACSVCLAIISVSGDAAKSFNHILHEDCKKAWENEENNQS